jgi:hypothetical protein
MEYNEIVKMLKEVAPSHLQDLLAAIGLVADEIEYSKAAVDKNLQNAINRNEYGSVHKLLELSEALHNNKQTLESFLEEHSAEEMEVGEDDLISDNEHAERVDYDSYRVDESVEYDLFSLVTFKRPAAFSFKGKEYNVSTWSRMLISLCELLYEEDNAVFKGFVEDRSMQGKRKPRFTTQKETLRKPVQIKNSNVYIETNLSANDIRKTALAMLDKYGISSDAVKIYLCKDLTTLHEE